MMETISKQPAAKNTTIISTFIKPLLTPLGAKDRKSTRLNSSHGYISYAVFCLKKKTEEILRMSVANAFPIHSDRSPRPTTHDCRATIPDRQSLRRTLLCLWTVYLFSTSDGLSS